MQKTYATEIAGGATATTGSAGSGVASYVVVNTVGGGLGNPGLTPNQLAGLAPLPAGYSWAPVASTDPTAGAAVSKWVSAVYNSNKAFTSVAYAQPNSSGQNWYVVDSNGKPVPLSTFSPYFAGLTGAQQNALNTAANIGNITAFNSNLAADGAKYQVVSGNSVDPALAASSNYTYQGVQSSPQGQGNGTVTSNQGATASTTSLAGGAVYANNKGQTTAIGPDGIYSVGGTGTWTNGALLPQNRSTTTINDGQITSFEGSNRANAGITSIDGSSVAVVNATGSTRISGSLVTISNAAGTSFTTVNNGFVNVVGGPTANTDGVKSLTSANAAVNVSGGAIINNGLIANNGFIANGGSTLNGGATVNGPTQLNGSLSVAPGNNIDMGGNRVQDVGRRSLARTPPTRPMWTGA